MHATVCDIIADLVQNSIEAGASQVTLKVSTNPERIDVCIADNGKGMDETTLKKAVDPFYSEAGKHVHRRIGLGLPFLIQTVEATGGAVDIESKPAKGTTVHFYFDAKHWDTPPMGNLAQTVLGLMNFGDTTNLILTRKTVADSYEISRNDLIDALGNLEEAGTLVLAKAYLESKENDLDQSNP
ncbi:MAG: sensor histidine kinase [bacterium]